MSISGKTKLLGIIGHPISHTFSPAMHNAALNELGLDYLYVPLAVERQHLGAAIKGLPALGFRGINVTIPHKQGVMPYLNKIDFAAQAIGAVNTIVFEDGVGHGYNTDWSGFIEDLQARHIHIDGRDCVVLGAGGSARAIVYGLLLGGAKVHLLARREEQWQQLKTELGRYIDTKNLLGYEFGLLAAFTGGEPLIINTTPVGMTPHTEESIWPLHLPFPKGSYVYDLVYNPPQTQLLKQAQSADCETANGLGMLLRQGAQAFVKWTGHAPNLTVMQAALPTFG